VPLEESKGVGSFWGLFGSGRGFFGSSNSVAVPSLLLLWDSFGPGRAGSPFLFGNLCFWLVGESGADFDELSRVALR
jgi:hypothetical protein